LRRREIQPANPLRAAVAPEREFFIGHPVPIYVPIGIDIGEALAVSTTICIDEYENV
jgi:hypothetical protein